MGLFLSDEQVALNELHAASQQTADHYRDAADFLDDQQVADELREIAQLRDDIVLRLEEVIRATGDLPSVPNADKEGIEQLIHRIRAALSPDETQEVLRQSLTIEQSLQEQAEALRQDALAQNYDELFYEFSANLETVRERINKLLDQLAT